MKLLPLLLCLGALPALAGADLPPPALVEQALHAHPEVQAAEAGTRSAAAQRQRLLAGPHETALRLGVQNRRDNPAQRRYAEQEVAIERALRLPGKAAQDAELGAAAVGIAALTVGDALHETARLLLRSWFDWQREHAAWQQWQAQRAILQRQAEVAARRVALGDAAALESRLAQAQLQQAEAQLAQAQHRAELAALELQRHFPGLPLPAQAVLLAPQVPAGTLDTWRERLLANNHELRLAQARAQQHRLLARRAEAERTPDPSIALRASNERDGQEKLFGLQLSIPFSGAGRAATARIAEGEADAAAAREAAALAKAEAEIRRAWRQAGSSYEQWQRLAAVAERMEANAELLDKAWRLGEGQFSELQQARRQAIETRLAATQAQLDANEARYRLEVDAHTLWAVAADEHADHAAH